MSKPPLPTPVLAHLSISPLPPSLFAKNHAEHHVLSSGSSGDHQGVVWVEHVLGSWSLVPCSHAVVGLVESLPGWDVVLAVHARELRHAAGPSDECCAHDVRICG